eukprot:1162065-Pelagomonas_calceolata.AAC.3
MCTALQFELQNSFCPWHLALPCAHQPPHTAASDLTLPYCLYPSTPGSSPGKTEGDSGEESYEAVLVLKEGRADSGSGHKSGAGRRGPPSTGIPVAAGRVSKESKGSRGKLTSSTGGRGRGRGQGQGRSGGRIYAAAGMGPKKTAGTVDRLFPAGPQCHPNSSGSSSNSKGDGEMAASKALMTPVPVVRLARYSMARTEAVGAAAVLAPYISHARKLQLATIPECFEMARVTGLSISQQMTCATPLACAGCLQGANVSDMEFAVALCAPFQVSA